MNPKLSIVIPVYNVEKYLNDCIDSLLNQTLKDIELIFVNDASTDNSLEILRKFENLYKDRLIVIDSKENLKQGGARNLGIKEAHAEYVGFVDSDDFVSSNMFSLLYERLLETDADAVFINRVAVKNDFCYSQSIDQSYQTDFVWNEKLLSFDNKTINESERESFINSFIGKVGGVWSGIWRKSIIENNDLYFPENYRFEDNYWASLIACYLNKISFVHSVGYFYRQNPTSTVNARNQSYYFDRIVLENKLMDDLDKRNLFNPYYAEWEYLFLKRYAGNTLWILYNKFDKLPVEQVNIVRNDVLKRFPNWNKNRYILEEYNNNPDSLRKMLRPVWINIVPHTLSKIKINIIVVLIKIRNIIKEGLHH